MILRDEEIILSYRKHPDPDLIGILFERYSHLIFSVCLNYLRDEEECKDVVLSIFEKLNQDLLRYDIKHFSSWLHTVTRNRCLKELKRKNAIVPIYNVENVQATQETIEHHDLTEIHLPHLNEGMNQLNEAQRICLQMFYIEEKSYNQICTMTGFTFKQVKSHIQNGKRNLKLFLEKFSHDKEQSSFRY